MHNPFFSVNNSKHDESKIYDKIHLACSKNVFLIMNQNDKSFWRLQQFNLSLFELKRKYTIIL